MDLPTYRIMTSPVLIDNRSFHFKVVFAGKVGSGKPCGLKRFPVNLVKFEASSSDLNTDGNFSHVCSNAVWQS